MSTYELLGLVVSAVTLVASIVASIVTVGVRIYGVVSKIHLAITTLLERVAALQADAADVWRVLSRHEDRLDEHDDRLDEHDDRLSSLEQAPMTKSQ